MSAQTTTKTPKPKKTSPKTSTAGPPVSGGAALDDAQGDGVATAADIALASELPATAREIDAGVSLGVVNLFRDPALVKSVQANAAAIDAEGRGTVADILSRIPGFIARFDALSRLSISAGRVHDSLTQDNTDFADFATAVANLFKKAGPLSPLKKDKALKKLAKNRDIQRGLPKMVKTRKKKARAKKVAATKGT